MNLYLEWFGISVVLGILASLILFAALKAEHDTFIQPSQIGLVGGGSACAYFLTLVISNLMWPLATVESHGEYEHRILMMLGYAFCAKFASFLAGIHYFFQFTIMHSVLLSLLTVFVEIVVLALCAWLFGV